jgi:Asp-tRNA(Asn)/Glu-tRNA(Gln) amidotransferase B subunit
LAAIDEVIVAFPEMNWNNIRVAKPCRSRLLCGQVLEKTGGKADPKQPNQIMKS